MDAIYDSQKLAGERHHTAKMINRGRDGGYRRSVSWHQNKSRDWRKIKDRHSHHSQRNQVRSCIAHDRLTGQEALPATQLDK